MATRVTRQFMHNERSNMRPTRMIAACLLAASVAACGRSDLRAESAETVVATRPPAPSTPPGDTPRVLQVSDQATGVAASAGSRDTAMFAGGCFWSMERPFEHVPGVVSTAVGYAGGHTTNPTYEQVNTRTTGHTETVLVAYDPARVSYEKLLDVYWHNIDPVTRDRQFCDAGPDYRTVIFTHGAAQQAAALRSRDALQKSGHFTTPVVTEVVPNVPFWRGEKYHQHFADRNPARYEAYRRGCGRDARLRALWGDAAAPYVPTT
jgi:peptide-methionine (S)-S-oxide reductase